MGSDMSSFMRETEILISEFYNSGNITGGVLHIVLDDGNIEDHHIIWCRDRAVEREDWDAVEIANRLLKLTYEQRETILGW